MLKVFNAFAKRKNIDINVLRFLLDGNRIGNAQTPADVRHLYLVRTSSIFMLTASFAFN